MKLPSIFNRNRSEYEDLSENERRILFSLVEFYQEHGYKSEAYNDPNTGGIYEHKFLTRAGFQPESDGSLPSSFLIAAQQLEARGLVKRLTRNPEFKVKGIWPTGKGFLAYSELQKKKQKNNPNRRLVLRLNWVILLEVFTLISAILTLLAQIFTPEIRNWFKLK